MTLNEFRLLVKSHLSSKQSAETRATASYIPPIYDPEYLLGLITRVMDAEAELELLVDEREKLRSGLKKVRRLERILEKVTWNALEET